MDWQVPKITMYEPEKGRCCGVALQGMEWVLQGHCFCTGPHVSLCLVLSRSAEEYNRHGPLGELVLLPVRPEDKLALLFSGWHCSSAWSWRSPSGLMFAWILQVQHWWDDFSQALSLLENINSAPRSFSFVSPHWLLFLGLLMYQSFFDVLICMNLQEVIFLACWKTSFDLCGFFFFYYLTLKHLVLVF